MWLYNAIFVGDDPSPTPTISESIMEQSHDPQPEEGTGQALDFKKKPVFFSVLV